MASRDIGTLDLASLERFQTELIQAGYEPKAGNRRTWVGPIAESLKELTAATKMQVVFADGWPFRHPALIVDGLDEWHLSARGDVCLWAVGDTSGQWLTLAGFLSRIEEWVEQTKLGFRPEDFALDAHLSFGTVRAGTMATVDLGRLGMDGARGKIGVISGTWEKDGRVLKIQSGRSGAIEGRWYYLGGVRVPPRSLAGARALLRPSQQNNFDRRYQAIRKHGTTQLFLIAWDREFGRESLALIAAAEETDVSTEAVEIAPTDSDVLQLRAGPDVKALTEKLVVVFGLGAVGSNAALRLAEVGTGRIALVDNARLRPGDVVRHAAGTWSIGDTKVHAVDFLIRARAPWTNVVTIAEAPWDPTAIEAIVDTADLVVETTGLASFTNMLSLICAKRSLPLVAGALYRSGAVARVRRQALGTDTLISERSALGRYPTIPPGDEPPVFEAGCSSAVNNASPIAVSSVAALLADVAVDLLTGRCLYPDEVIDVYRPLTEAPFDGLGRVPI